MWCLGAVLAAMCVAGVAWAEQPHSAAATLGAARQLSQSGAFAAASSTLEAWLARPPSNVSASDLVAMELEAGRVSFGAKDKTRAQAHLAQLQRRLSELKTDAVVIATFRRETARLAEQLTAFDVAEPLLADAAAGFRETAPGYAAEAANALGSVQLELSKPEAALGSFQQALALLEATHAPANSVVHVLVNRVKAGLEANRVDQAGLDLELARAAAGDAPALLRLVALVEAQWRLRQAETVRADAILQELVAQSASAQDDVAAQALYLTASARYQRQQLSEADAAGQQALELLTLAYGPSHPAVGRALHLLGLIQDLLGDTTTALAYLTRSEAMQREIFGADSAQVAASMADRARVELDAGRIQAGQSTAQLVLRMPPVVAHRERRTEGMAHIVLAVARMAQRDPVAAERHFQLAERLILQGFGPVAPELGYLRLQYGRLLARQDRFAAASGVLQSALAFYVKAGADRSMRAAEVHTALAALAQRQGDRHGALESSGRSYAILQELQRGGGDMSGADGEFQNRSAKQLLLDHATLLVVMQPGDPAAMAEAFRAAQQAHSSRAADAIRLASARLAAQGDGLAKLLRTRADSADTARQAEFLLRDLARSNGPAGEDEQARLRRIVADKQAAVAAADSEISSRYPAFTRLSGRDFVDVAAVQKRLSEGEIVLMPLIGQQASLLWTITATSIDVSTVDVPALEVEELVRRVRRSVDLNSVPAGGGMPVFDDAAAAALFERFVAPAMTRAEGKSTIILIPDGALQSLPLQLLLDRDRQWLIRRAAIDVMPSAAALVARGEARPGLTGGRFLGVGNPVLRDGEPPTDKGPLLLTQRAFRAAVEALPELPETADELRHMAMPFGNDRARLLLGAGATRAQVLTEKLSDYKVIAFATHAVMAGELRGLDEPAIVLTPAMGDMSTSFFTSSQIATLDLSADLVILSACNTAAPDGGPFSDGFSGLARAFFYAGSRSLLVSHWAVSSMATVALTTGFVRTLADDPMVRKAAALRTAMLAMLDSPDPTLHQPALWAAFSVIGE